jgi:hypothetical protein
MHLDGDIARQISLWQGKSCGGTYGCWAERLFGFGECAFASGQATPLNEKIRFPQPVLFVGSPTEPPNHKKCEHYNRHRRGVCPYMRYPLIRYLFLVLAFAISSHGLDQPDGHQFHTSIAPVPGENLAGPCRFDLWIPNPGSTLNATWITYDRGFDISKYYGDSDVRAFAEKHRIALMMAHQFYDTGIAVLRGHSLCRTKSRIVA